MLYKITRSSSIFTGATAFSDNTPGPDTLIVDADAFLIATGGFGAFLNKDGAWTVTVNGTLMSQNSNGIYLDFDNVGTSTITIGQLGSVYGAIEGILAGSSATIKNAGVISGGADGIRFGGTATLVNSGTIQGTYSLFGIPGSGAQKVTNSGLLSGNVNLDDGNDTLTNSGTVGGDMLGGIGNDRLTNSGTVTGSLLGDDGNDTLINSGSVWGDVLGGIGNDTVKNFAVVGGVVVSGTIINIFDLGGGDDEFFGGSNTEAVRDADGADLVNLGGGRDNYVAVGAVADGNDTINGGAGRDVYNAIHATSSLLINLDVVSHDLSPLSKDGLTPANTAKDFSVSAIGTDTIIGFEDVRGGSQGDAIYGSAAANSLEGFGGGDNLFGHGGNDTLDGGAGADGLAGGAGRDLLFGGSEGDFFQFFKASDSGVTKATRDVIGDFQDGLDMIDLAYIDANAKLSGSQAFVFLGTNVAVGFSGAGGELRATWTASGQVLEADINGDKLADFAIEVIDPSHSIVWSATDGDDFFL